MLCASIASLSGNSVLTFQGEAPTCPAGQFSLLLVGDSMPSPFNLTLADAGVLCSAVLLVWASAFAIRLLMQLLRDRTGEGPAHDEG